MLNSLLLYCLFMFLSVGMAYLADKYNSIVLRNLLILFLIVITGFRGHEVGIDTPNYIETWDEIIFGIPVYSEIGFQWLMLLLQKFTLNPTSLFVSCSAIIFTFLIIRLWDFRQIASFTIMIAVLYMLVLMRSMNIMRQYCAIAIVFFSTRYLFQKGYLKFILGVIVATLFHTSSLLAISFLGFELLQWKQLSFRKKAFFILLIAIGVSLSVIVFSFINSKYGNYFEQTEVGLGLLTIVTFIFVLLSFVASNLWRKRIGIDYNAIGEHRYWIKVIFVAYFMGILLQSLGYFFPYMDRIGLMFSLFGIVFWGVLFKLTINVVLKLVYTFSLLFLIGWPFLSSILNNGYGTVPYTFCW